MKFRVGSVAVDLIADGDRVCAHGSDFEQRSLEIWGELCARGGTILDVGAYTGLYAIAAALHGCRTLAFEPMPFNADRLQENARGNGVFGRVELTRAAVSDHSGEARISYRRTAAFLTSGASLAAGGPSRNLLVVPTVSIDDLRLDYVGAIKIDVERAEPMVLAGARATIARCKPAILVEVLDEQRADAVRAALPSYRLANELDGRNWLMLPC